MVAGQLPVEVLGKYRLLEQVGRGGMAAVFKAIDTDTNQAVAVKVLSPVLAQESQFSKRFEREAEVVMRLVHPNIVPVVDYGQDAGYAYLVMPLLQVGSLADRLEQGPLTPAEGGRIMNSLSGALGFAHEQGVIHRDVKPSNVLLDEQGNPLLADFGLARIHDASVSLTGSALLGTPAYMSPEQARGEKVGAASDQYSLGVILYQLCTGELPFAAETPMAVMLKHINEPIPLARLRSPNVPEVIEKVILKATAKAPTERFASVGEMNAAFQAALAHARDPFSNPAPNIEVPPSSIAASITVHEPEPENKRNRLGRMAAAAAVLLLLLLACPVAASGLMEMLDGAASPAEGSGLSPEDMSDPQLTALAGTIESLSTQLAGSMDGTQSPELIQTAVMATLEGDFEVLGSLDGTPTGTVPPGPSPTPIDTATPGPSPTPSKTPTKTKTPTPGPSPTPSDTPTKTKTPTPGPSPTPSKTPTPDWTATMSASGTASPFPSSTPFSSPSPDPSETVTAIMTAPPTPTEDPCMNIWSSGPPSFVKKKVTMDIGNDNPVPIKIVLIRLSWPDPPNGNLDKVKLEPDTIWDVEAPPPEVWITSFMNDHSIPPFGGVKDLVFIFRNDVQAWGYFIEIGFDNGCSISRGF